MNSVYRHVRLRRFNHFNECIRKVSSQPNQLNISERSSTVKQLELHPAVASEVDNGLYSMRQHPGTIRKKCDELPSKLMEAMMVVASGCKKSDIFEEGNKLRNQLWGRHLPPEKHDYIMQLKKQRTRAQEAIAAINEVDEEMLSKLEEKVTTRLMQDTIHPWHPLDLSDRTCLLYLFSRTPAEYCILHKIFTELKQRDPNFSPSTLFDFGSGVASGYWAAKEVWKEPFKEVYNVDSNLNMNNLASQLLKIAGEKSCAEEGVYFRQFFPLSPRPTFDLTLSAFSLLELPSFKERMEAISRLWSKTNKYLVIVEDGTIAGYTAVMEARKLILYVESQKIGETSHINAHVAAPCPHEFNCPIISKEKRPCNFEVSYLLPQCLLGKQIRKSHLYSYVIVTRGARSNNDCQWSRCVNNTTLHKKQVHLKLCTPEGKLESVSLSKKYNSSNAYKCAKLTKWGDLLPGKIHDCDKTKLGDHK